MPVDRKGKWVTRSEEEIAVSRMRDEHRNAIARIIVTLMLFWGFLLLPLSYGRGHPGPSRPPIVQLHSTSDIFLFLSFSFGMAFIAMLSVWSKLYRMFVPPEMICLKCWAMKRDDGNRACSCGGEFVPDESIKWVEE
jgi:hypothetical protein